MAKASIYSRTLQKAAEKLGGERALARYLKVPLPDLFVWMRPGSVPPPQDIFLRAVDVVLDDLAVPDQERAQRVRVSAIHQDWVDPLDRLPTPSRSGSASTISWAGTAQASAQSRH